MNVPEEEAELRIIEELSCAADHLQKADYMLHNLIDSYSLDPETRAEIIDACSKLAPVLARMRKYNDRPDEEAS